VVNVDRDNLSKQLVEILWSREKCASISEDSRAFALTNHDIAKVGQRSLEIFDQILASGSASEFSEAQDQEPVIIEETASDLSNPKSGDVLGKNEDPGQVVERVDKECCAVEKSSLKSE